MESKKKRTDGLKTKMSTSEVTKDNGKKKYASGDKINRKKQLKISLEKFNGSENVGKSAANLKPSSRSVDNKMESFCELKRQWIIHSTVKLKTRKKNLETKSIGILI